MSDYVVIYEQDPDGGWGAYLPDLPGVAALGATRSEVGERIQEALSAFADDLRDRGCPLRTAPPARSPSDRWLGYRAALGQFETSSEAH